MLFAWTSATTFAQTFKKVYTPDGGAKFEAVFGLDEHASGFWLGGAAAPSGRFVIKTDASGNVLWHRATFTENAVGGVVAAPDGGVVLLETGVGNPTVVRKLNATGAEVWARAYHLSAEGPTRIAPHPGGGTLVSATSTVPVALRHDDNGNLVSALRIPQQGAFGIKAAPNGSLVSWGRATNGRFSFVSSATNGFEINFGDVAHGFGYPPVRLADGAWAAGAVVNLSGEPGLRLAFVKADADLHLTRRKISTSFAGSLQGLSNVFVSEPAPTPDGGILVPLLYQNAGIFESKIVKLDANLNVQWTRFIKAGTNPQEAYFTIKQTPSGFVLGGTLLTLDANGNPVAGEILFESANADLTGCTGFSFDPNFSMNPGGTVLAAPFVAWADFVPGLSTGTLAPPIAANPVVTELCAAPPGGNCAAPVNLSVMNVRATTAMLRWRPAQGASGYELSYRVAPNGAWTTQTVQGIVRRITGLQAGKTYQWRVRAVCINGGFSSYANGPDFSTPACDAPNAPTVSDITFTTAKVSWVLDGVQHKIHYRPVGTQTWTEMQANGANASPRTLTGLTPGTEYEVAISRRCPPPGNNWSSVGNATKFWTKECGVPRNLTISESEQGSVTLSWDAVPYASSYRIRYKAREASEYQAMETPETHVQISGLNAAFTYGYQVAAICASGINGDWSNEVFTGPCKCFNQGFISTGNNVGNTGQGAAWNGLNVCVPADFTVEQNLTITQCTLRMAPNVRIFVNPGCTLTITNSDLGACGGFLWDGIETRNGRIVITNTAGGSTVVADAKIAVTCTLNDVALQEPRIDIIGVAGGTTTFTRNLRHIVLENLRINPFLLPKFNISSAVFNCPMFCLPELGTTCLNFTQDAVSLRNVTNTLGGNIPPGIELLAIRSNQIFDFFRRGISIDGLSGHSCVITGNQINKNGPFGSPNCATITPDVRGVIVENSSVGSYQISTNTVNMRNFASLSCVGIDVRNNMAVGSQVQGNTITIANVTSVLLSPFPFSGIRFSDNRGALNSNNPVTRVFRNVITIGNVNISSVLTTSTMHGILFSGNRNRFRTGDRRQHRELHQLCGRGESGSYPALSLRHFLDGNRPQPIHSPKRLRQLRNRGASRHFRAKSMATRRYTH